MLAAGVRLPAARTAGKPWPTAPRTGMRRGIEEHLADAGFQFFFVDCAHGGGRAARSASTAMIRRTTRACSTPASGPSPRRAARARPIGPIGWRHGGAVAALRARPASSVQVWSRHEGYPGRRRYLEFHKIRWPGGLKLWRVTGPGVDLGDKEPYDPDARGRAGPACRRTSRTCSAAIAARTAGRAATSVVVAPFDTELFGHWWFEGPDFLERRVPRAGRQRDAIRPRHRLGSTCDSIRPAPRSGLAGGSWGANGDFSMWLNEQTAWTWERLWPLEQAFWDVAPARARVDPRHARVLAQAARELLLAQSSDWQFIISTGAAADYAEQPLPGTL